MVSRVRGIRKEAGGLLNGVGPLFSELSVNILQSKKEDALLKL